MYFKQTYIIVLHQPRNKKNEVIVIGLDMKVALITWFFVCHDFVWQEHWPDYSCVTTEPEWHLYQLMNLQLLKDNILQGVHHQTVKWWGISNKAFHLKIHLTSKIPPQIVHLPCTLYLFEISCTPTSFKRVKLLDPSELLKQYMTSPWLTVWACGSTQNLINYSFSDA